MSRGDTIGLRNLIAQAPEILAESDQKQIPPPSLGFDDYESRFVADQNSFPAAPHTQRLLRRRAEQLLEEAASLLSAGNSSLAESKEQYAANLILLYQSLTFQHQFLHQYSKRLEKLALLKSNQNRVGCSAPAGIAEESDQEERLADQQRLRMIFRGEEEASVKQLVGQLPREWTVVQISCTGQVEATRFKESRKDEASKTANPCLCILRLTNDDSEVLYCKLDNPSSEGVSPFLHELQSIIVEHSHVMKSGVTDRKQYWKLRNDLSDRMKALLKSVENHWLGAARAYLLGSLADPAACKAIDSLIEEIAVMWQTILSRRQRAELRCLLSATNLLQPEEYAAALNKVLGPVANADSAKVLRLVEIHLKSAGVLRGRRNPVILILDPELQTFPWESIPILFEARQAVSRIPSLQFLRCLWETHQATDSSVVQSGISSQNIFYLVNPDRTLPKTQERIDKALKSFSSMEGLVGQSPEPGQLANVLCRKDALVYCGHGSGSVYISGDDIEKLRVRAVPLLLGCSSGQLVRLGRNLDPLGTAQSYLIASAAALLGFLWPVSDKDVDNWTVELFSSWLSGSEPDLLQAAADKKPTFQYFFNAAAVVFYGLPVITTKSEPK